MTLRARLILAVLAATLAVVGGFAFVAVRQQTLLTDQLDDELRAVEANIGRAAEFFIGTPDPAGRSRGAEPPTGELYLAIVLEGRTTVVARPDSQPGLRPGLPDTGLAALAERGPVELDAIGGSGKVRAVVIPIGTEGWAIAALSTDAVVEAQRHHLVTSTLAIGAVVVALGLVVWWVDRLGVRPLLAVARAAEEVAAGGRDHRVEHPNPGTEAGRLGVAFNAMLDARQGAEQRQRRFVADASHELRTPLTTLRGYAALHASGGLADPERVDDAMRRIRGEADRMATLVDDLLTLAALDEDRPLDLTDVDLTQLLVDIGRDSAAVQPDRNVGTSGVEAGLTVPADVHLLTQALTAITTNALRHTPPDAGLVLAAGNVGDAVEIEISDHGPGIEPEQLERLFDRFYRVDPARTRGQGGTGLGLSIARSIVEAHGGSIAARSNRGSGVAVTLTWPRSRD